MKRKAIFLILLVWLVMTALTGCDDARREKEAKTLAEEYLNKLSLIFPDDTIYLTDSGPERYGDLYAFIAFSVKYSDDFRIYVNTDGSICDTYFAVSLRDEADEEFLRIFSGVFADGGITYELYLNKSVSFSALSCRKFSSIYEAYEAIDGLTGLVIIQLTPGGDSQIPDGQLSCLLTGIQQAGLYGDVSIDGDERVFHIYADAINYTRSDDPPGAVTVYDFVP